MHKDILFEGVLATAVSLLFLFMTFVEIPFYSQELEVQKVAMLAVLASLAIVAVGYLRTPKSKSSARLS